MIHFQCVELLANRSPHLSRCCLLLGKQKLNENWEVSWDSVYSWCSQKWGFSLLKKKTHQIAAFWAGHLQTCNCLIQKYLVQMTSIFTTQILSWSSFLPSLKTKTWLLHGPPNLCHCLFILFQFKSWSWVTMEKRKGSIAVEGSLYCCPLGWK